MPERDDERLADRIREAWGRPELSGAERAEFDASLRARLSQPQPRRWALPGAALAALAAVAMVVLSVRGDDPAEQVDWLDSLTDAQAVALGEVSYAEEIVTFDLTSTDARVSLFADQAWDSSADTVWDSDETLDVGHEYEALAFWLEPATTNTETKTPDVP